eukprot:2945431-Pleurochrysis_carterae.AAC.1
MSTQYILDAYACTESLGGCHFRLVREDNVMQRSRYTPLNYHMNESKSLPWIRPHTPGCTVKLHYFR